MADGITVNYSFTLPEVGASQDNWGGKLNQNWDDVDSIIKLLDNNLQGQINGILSTSFTAGDGISVTGDLNTGLTVGADLATASDLRAGTADKVVAADAVYAASAFVTLTPAASVAVDMEAGRNFVLTMNQESELANPTNQTPGQSGVIVIKQNGTGGHALTAASHWRFPAGIPEVAQAANAISTIAYIVLESGIILAALSSGYEA